MTRREIRELIFKMVFRVEFHKEEEIPEQLRLFMDTLDAASEKDRAYIREKGLGTVRRHAEDFVRLKLAPASPANDGKQTPMRGHPVFPAQHATATCCRGCLNKWWKVPLGVPLSDVQQDKVVGLIMAWIERQLKNGCSAR